MIKLLELPIKELNKDKVYVYAYRSYSVRTVNLVKVGRPINVTRVFKFADDIWKSDTVVNNNQYRFKNNQLFYLFNHSKNLGKDYAIYEIDSIRELPTLREALDSMLELIS